MVDKVKCNDTPTIFGLPDTVYLFFPSHKRIMF